METKIDFSQARIAFWNDTYNRIKQLDFKVYTKFNWKTFKERKFPVIGTVHGDNLDSLKKVLSGSNLSITNIWWRSKAPVWSSWPA